MPVGGCSATRWHPCCVRCACGARCAGPLTPLLHLLSPSQLQPNEAEVRAYGRS